MKQRGFTIPELLIVIIITSMFTTLILSFTINYWRFGYLLEGDLDTFVTRINVEDFLRENIGTSSGFINQNSIVDTHTQNPATIGSYYWVVKHAIPGNIPVGSTATTTPLLYYKRYSLTPTGSFIMNGLQPYEDEYLLYLDGSTKQLLLRTLANPSASGNRVLTSCPKSIATSSCPEDKVLAGDLSSIDIRFFSKSGNQIDWTSLYDSTTSTYVGPDYTAVEVLELTLNISKKVVFQKTNSTQSSTIVRIALRNT